MSPETNTHVPTFEELSEIIGCNFCVGSSYATHVGMLNCATCATKNHVSHEWNMPSCTCNASAL